MKRKRIQTPLRLSKGFTLIELLVVLGILLVLMSLLVPAISKVRKTAQASNSRAQIGQLSAAIQAYFGDFNSYPGPVPNNQLGVAACGITTILPVGSMPVWDVTQMSMAENLYLGLLGGLEPTAVGATTFQFDSTKAGSGPRQLGGTPKKYLAYTDNSDISAGRFTDSNGESAMDTFIPEFVDRFPDSLPLLYLRARVGSPGVAFSGNTMDPVQQYDLEQVNSYTLSKIGVGRSVLQSKYTTSADYTNAPHGLHSVTPTACIGEPPTTPAGLVKVYPYDLYAALLNPNQTRVAATVALPANSPRQKDGFILMSAGIDRVYGTEDDIANFGSY